MMVSAMISLNPLDEAKEGMAADLKAAIAASDSLAADGVRLRPAFATLTGIPDPAVSHSDRMAGIIDSFGRRGGRSE